MNLGPYSYLSVIMSLSKQAIPTELGPDKKALRIHTHILPWMNHRLQGKQKVLLEELFSALHLETLIKIYRL